MPSESSLELLQYRLHDPFDGWSDDLRPQLHQVARDLKTQIDSIAAGTTEAIGQKIPEYRAGRPDSLLGEVEGIVRVNLQLFVKVLIEERMPVPQELTFLSELASVRVRQGLSMESILHAYRIGHQISWEAVLRMTERYPESTRIAVKLSRPTMGFIDVLIVNVSAAYLRATKSSEADRDAEARTFAESILRGELPESMSDVSRESLRTLSGKHGFLVFRGRVGIEGETTSRSIRRIAATISQVGVAGGRTAITVPYEQGLVGFLEVGPEGVEPVCRYLIGNLDSIEMETSGSVRLGISRQCLDIENAPRGLRDAEEALLMTRAERPVVALPLIPIFAHLLGQANQTLTNIAGDRMESFLVADQKVAGELSRTIVAYADANQNSRLAAEALHCHVNTIKNRIRRIHELTGLDPNSFSDLVDLVAAQELLPATT